MARCWGRGEGKSWQVLASDLQGVSQYPSAVQTSCSIAPAVAVSVPRRTALSSCFLSARVCRPSCSSSRGRRPLYRLTWRAATRCWKQTSRPGGGAPRQATHLPFPCTVQAHVRRMWRATDPARVLRLPFRSSTRAHGRLPSFLSLLCSGAWACGLPIFFHPQLDSPDLPLPHPQRLTCVAAEPGHAGG